jgi:FdhD protein
MTDTQKLDIALVPDGQNEGFSWPIARIRATDRERIDDHVPVEEPLEIVINGQSVAVLMRMPGQEKELVGGFCVSEGYVRRVEDILLIHHCGSGHPAPGREEEEGMGESRNRVQVRVVEEGLFWSGRPGVIRLIGSGCGAVDVSAMSETLPLLSHEFSVSASMLLGLGKAMRDQQRVHSQVGGTHAAALFDVRGRAVTVAEDIGRHNAVDKAVGYCLLRGISLENKVLVTSGRASSEMATKAIRVGIPIVATISAPTSLAVQLAQDRGLTLIGYLRGGRLNVYTHEERLDLTENQHRLWPG